MKLSIQLKQWRNKEKVSQSEAAARLKVSVRTYQEWEQGRATPRGIGLQAVQERIK